MFELILIPIIVGVVTQMLKLLTDGIPDNFNFRHLLNDYGGMPSSHTAFVAAVATVVGLRAGFDSAAFAVAFALMIVVVRDAIGFRREIGRNASSTNLLAKEVFKKMPAKRKKVMGLMSKHTTTGLLNEKMGHSMLEVAAGFGMGAVMALVFYILFLAI